MPLVPGACPRVRHQRHPIPKGVHVAAGSRQDRLDPSATGVLAGPRGVVFGSIVGLLVQPPLRCYGTHGANTLWAW